MHPGGTEVQELTFRFAQLEVAVRVTVRPAASGSAEPEAESSFDIVSIPPTLEPVDDFVDQFGITPELEEQALAALTVAALINLDLRFLSHLESRLRSSDTTWTGRARIARAFRAGVAASRRLGGEVRGETSLATPFRNSYYVILRAPGLAHGGWTSEYRAFAARVFRQDGEYHPNTITHGFATQAESSAYLAGARRPWPPQLHQ